MVLTIADNQLYLPDLLMLTMIQRSYGLVDGVIDMVDCYNLHAAAPLVRLQLDSLFRASYLARAPRLDDIVTEVMNGTPFRRMRDAEGKNLTDARLKYLAEPHHAWAVPVYDRTSGWIHFSSTHVRATFQFGESNEFNAGIPLRPDSVPESLWFEILGAMVQATDELFAYVEGWASRKGMPPGEARDIDLNPFKQ